MSEFVEECRREWRRLGVPDPVANEMAADLTADLQEAEAEGGSPEDVLGNSAFDPRRFAAAWAVARGVTGPPTPDHRSPWRSPIAIAMTALLGLLAVGAGLALMVGFRGRSFAFAVHRAVAGPGIGIFPSGPNRIVVPGTLGQPIVGTQITAVGIQPLALAVLFVGVMGLALLAVFFFFWSDWPGSRRYRRRRGQRSPNWN